MDNEEDIYLYYIAKGEVEIRLDLPQVSDGNGIKLLTVKEGNFIGAYSFVSGRMIKEILRCKTRVKAFIIRRKKFLDIIQHFPKDKVSK